MLIFSKQTSEKGYCFYEDDFNGTGIYFDSTTEIITKPISKPTATPTPVAKKTGWVKESGKWYYYDANSKKATGWLQDGRNWYYFDPVSGAMVTGMVKIEGKMSKFSDSGAWIGYV